MEAFTFQAFHKQISNENILNIKGKDIINIKHMSIKKVIKINLNVKKAPGYNMITG